MSAPLRLVVIGLGYVGLPLVAAASRSGLQVTGVERSPHRLEQLRAGRSPVDDLSDQDITGLLAAGVEVTDNPVAVKDADVVVLCVPTPLAADGTPDLTAVRTAAATVGEYLQPDTLVVLESTTYPGTTEDVVLPLLEDGGLRAGHDFRLAYSPERIDPGNPTYGLTNTPKVVGGLTADCTRAAAGFYSRFCEQVVPVSSTKVAELSKLLENTYRNINIALVNEMAVFCHELGVDLWEAIDAAATKPFGFAAFRPGPGVGGHCIPIDPDYLSWAVRRLGYPFRFVELAREINARMPTYVVTRLTRLLNDVGLPVRGTRILLLGVAYKADVSDERESPAVPVARALRDLGAVLSYSDPHVGHWAPDGLPVPRVADPVDGAAEHDLVLLLAAHRAFDLPAISAAAALFFDTRGRAAGPTVHRL